MIVLSDGIWGGEKAEEKLELGLKRKFQLYSNVRGAVPQQYLYYTFKYEEIFQPVDYYGKFVDAFIQEQGIII
ncbi:MAG: hypothetical protein B6U95_00790 [Thermofilum sp. ex4484_82]|nr:MAG: hypothetical protein B6U95_00790 [Thermofilum sp. ex4484_82]OYT39943.1 MAG: hypothetical protein B6U96_00800 [Archaeoglobales archaeon ex4484_92]